MSSKEKGRKSTQSKRLSFFIAMFAAGSVLILVYLACTGNTFQKFTDVVCEYTSIHASNKSAERNLFYMFSIGGAVVYAIYYLFTQKQVDSQNKKTAVTEDPKYKYVLLALLVFAIMHYFVYQGTNGLLFAGMAIGMIALCKDQELVVLAVAFVFVNAYAICGIYRVYVIFGTGRPLQMNAVVLISLVLAGILCAVSKKHSIVFERGILISQLFIPLTLLVYLASDYKYGEEIRHIHVPYKVQISVCMLLAFFVMEAAVFIKKYWKSKDMELEKIVSFGACVSILAFNRFSGSGAILSTDLHHPFENIIGFSQIFELGQKAFEEYIPVSGMYSVLQGFFLSFFGHGQVSYYFLTQNVFYLVIIIVIVWLLKQQMSADRMLFVSLVFHVMDYNRIALILPVMLLLTWPKLIENKNLWLKAWYLTSFVHALYYPVFGAAVCIGFFPLGIWQILSYAKSGKLSADMKKPVFWIWWMICSIPVILGIPYLLGTAKHMLAMGGQTVYADGITRFGQTVADNFLSYIPSISIRLTVYYIFSFLIVIGVVWVSAAAGLKLGDIRIQNHKVSVKNPVLACICIAIGLTMLVSFSYTVIRMDIGSIYARSAGVVYAVFVILILLTGQRFADVRMKQCLVVFASVLMGAVAAEGFFAADSSVNLAPYYTVPDGYVYVENDQVERLGTCFVEPGVYDSIENTYNSVAGADREDGYLGFAGVFGHYYLCNLKGDSTMELSATIKGYHAAKETVDLVKEQGTIIGTEINSISNYYFYYWLISSGEYVWSPENGRFLPNDAGVPREEILEQNKYITLSQDGAGLGRTPGSWGASMDSLRKIFTKADVEHSIQTESNMADIYFTNEVNGSDADFVYVEFEGMDKNFDYTLFNLGDVIVQDTQNLKFGKYLMKKDYNRNLTVVINWMGEDGNTYGMNCAMSHGKLLLPLGGCRCWLLNNHSGLRVTVLNEHGESVAVPHINTIEFLKLREVQ